MSRSISRLAALVTHERVVVYATAYLVLTIGVYCLAILTGDRLVDRNGNVLGTDFLQFYTAGWLIDHGQASHLFEFVPPFSFPRQVEIEMQVLSPQGLPAQHAYVLPPFYALLFVPLSRMPYAQAYLVWLVVTVAFYAATLLLLRPFCPILKGPSARTALVAALAFPPFLECLLNGQNAVTSLFLLSLTFVLLQRGRETAAGLSLGFLVYKPQLALVVLLFFLATGRMRALAAFVAVGGALALLSAVMVGPEGVGDYLRLSATMLDWPYTVPSFRTWNMHSLHSFFVLLVGEPMLARLLTAILSLAVVVALLVAWRRSDVLSRQYEIAIIGAVLLSPHVFGYDLSVLLIPWLLIAGEAIAEGPRTSATERVLLSLATIMAVVSKFVAMATGLQLTVPAVVAILAVRVRKSMTERQGDDARTAWRSRAGG